MGLPYTYHCLINILYPLTCQKERQNVLLLVSSKKHTTQIDTNVSQRFRLSPACDCHTAMDEENRLQLCAVKCWFIKADKLLRLHTQTHSHSSSRNPKQL